MTAFNKRTWWWWCYYHIRQLRFVSVLTLIPPQHAPLPHSSFILNSITVILSTTTYLSLRLPASNWFRKLSPVQFLKLLKSCHNHSCLTLSSLAQNNWTHRIQTPFSHLQSPHNHPTLHISTTSSLLNLLAALALHLWLPSLDHQHHPRYL